MFSRFFRVTGEHHFLVTGKLKPRPPVPAEEETGEGGCDSLEAHVVKDDLLHRYLARSEDHLRTPAAAQTPARC